MRERERERERGGGSERGKKKEVGSQLKKSRHDQTQENSKQSYKHGD